MDDLELPEIELKSDTIVQVSSKPYTQTELRVISYVEQLYWTNGIVPTEELVAKGLNLKPNTVHEIYVSEKFAEALETKGIPFGLHGNGVLSPQQILLVNVLMDVHNKATLREKLKLLNISTSKYNTWLRDPAFQDYLRVRTQEVFKSADSDAYKNLVQLVQEGDLNSIKFFFEMRGIYNPKVQVDINIETVMYQVIEIIARHVQDRGVIEAIANDIDGIVNKKVNELAS